MRLARDGNAISTQLLHGDQNIVHTQVDHRARCSTLDQQASLAEAEEGEPRWVEDRDWRFADQSGVERHGAIEIVGVLSDLMQDHRAGARSLIHTLCEIAGKGGNLLLNVGPRGDGTLAPEQEERLGVIAGWMGKHGESILGTEPGLEPWQFYGPSTRRGDDIYLHLLMRPYETVTVRGVRTKRVRSIKALGTGTALRYEARTQIADALFNSPDPLGELTIAVPESALDEHATVIKIEFADAPVTR